MVNNCQFLVPSLGVFSELSRGTNEPRIVDSRLEGLRLAGDGPTAREGDIDDPVSKAKCVMFTAAGLNESERLFRAMFAG